MNTLCKSTIKKSFIVAVILTLLLTGMSPEAWAASGAKKYTVKIHNASSNTVIKKGSKLKLKCSAVAKNGSRAKVKYKSSNRKIVTVSKKGVIKGKRKGKAKITVYVKQKGKIRGKKTITVRVGKRVSSIKLSGYNYLRAGKSSKISATVKPSNATNKKLKWKSSNPSVATVDSKGNVTGKGNGKAVITASAKDGSGKAKSITVYSHKYTKNDTQWIAHRGLHTNATENSAAAFEAAGKAGFWGCECDLYETKRTQEIVSNDEEEGEGEGEGEGEEGEDPVIEEHFEIVIDHDGNFKRVFGVNKAPTDLTAEQIRSNSKLAEVCFFDEYLKICKKYNMIPIVEIKMLSDEGVEKMIDMLYDADLLEYAQIISFKAALLEKTQDYAFEKYAIKPYTGYLLTGNEDKVENGIETAVEKGFSGVNIKYSLFTEDISDICRINGLGVCTWTYRDSAVCNHNLYKHVVSGKYKVDSITVDGKYF